MGHNGEKAGKHVAFSFREKKNLFLPFLQVMFANMEASPSLLEYVEIFFPPLFPVQYGALRRG